MNWFANYYGQYNADWYGAEAVPIINPTGFGGGGSGRKPRRRVFYNSSIETILSAFLLINVSPNGKYHD